MGKPDAPDPPDYAAAAREQGTANVNSAIASNFLNQVSQFGPNGSLTYSYNPGNGYTLPDGTVVPAVTATTTLSPEQQRLLDQNNQISGNLNDLAIDGIGYVARAAANPVGPEGLPSMTAGLATNPLSGTAAPTGLSVQGNYDLSGVGAMPNAADFAGQRDQITKAYMDRLQPYIDRDRAALDTKLANQGITQGSEAYGWDRAIQGRNENDQRIAALLAGDQQQQNLFNNAMGIRQQGVGEAISQGNFNNQSQNQQFAQNQQALSNINNAAQGNFAQGLAAGQFGNQARSQALQEADYFQNAPLNILNALRTGNQVQMPQFGNVAGGAQIAAPPIYNAASDQYAAQMQNYNAQLQANNGLMQGIAGIGSAAIMASDRRLKKNIRKLFTRLDGLGVYLYQYIWGKWHIGVMADEVAVLRPDALGPSMGGFMTVNYGVLNNG